MTKRVPQRSSQTSQLNLKTFFPLKLDSSNFHDYATESYMTKFGDTKMGIPLLQGCTTYKRKRNFCGREIVLQNAGSCGRALIKMFCYVTVKKQLLGTITIC